jgi:Tfp pilus assembly protein PilN
MAVYEGAHPRSTSYPRRRPEAFLLRPRAPELPRRRSRVSFRSRRRPRFFGIAMGLIVVAFLLSFFSLIQTVRVSASGYDMEQLNQQLAQLQNQRQQDLADINRLDRESAIRRQAISNGLSQLPPPVVIPAR